jgi:hypothetical protein
MKIKRIAAIFALTFILATGVAKAKTLELPSLASQIQPFLG